MTDAIRICLAALGLRGTIGRGFCNTVLVLKNRLNASKRLDSVGLLAEVYQESGVGCKTSSASLARSREKIELTTTTAFDQILSNYRQLPIWQQHDPQHRRKGHLQLLRIVIC